VRHALRLIGSPVVIERTTFDRLQTVVILPCEAQGGIPLGAFIHGPRKNSQSILICIRICMRDAASPLGQALAAWLRWSNSRAEPGSKLAAISRTSAATRRHAELVGEAVDKSDINGVVESIWHHMGSAVRPIDFDVAQQPHDRPHRQCKRRPVSTRTQSKTRRRADLGIASTFVPGAVAVTPVFAIGLACTTAVTRSPKRWNGGSRSWRRAVHCGARTCSSFSRIPGEFA